MKFFKERKEQKQNLKKIKKGEVQEKKLNKKFIIVLSLGVLISLVFGMVFYKYNPIENLENRNGLTYLTNYTYSGFTLDKPVFATFVSIFPAGLFIGIYYIFKEEEKHINFVLPTVIVSILEMILLVSNLKIGFLPNYITALGFGLLQIFMMIYIFANVEEKFFNLIKSAYISLLGLALLMFVPAYEGLKSIFLDLSYIIFVLEIYIALNYTDKRFWRLSSWVFTVITVLQSVGFIIVNFVWFFVIFR